ncbi:MAG: hypothetical protein Q8R36_01855 [bacterium]|nr:hypothetical protein [bacterium]
MKFPISNFQFPISEQRGQAAPRCNSGQAAIISILFFVAVTAVLAVSTSSSALKEEFASRSGVLGKKGYFLSEAAQEDAIYRIFTGKPIGQSVTLSLGGDTATTTITNVGLDRKDITAAGNSGKNTRKTQVSLLVGEGTSFVYGVQVGAGGLVMENNSSVLGNVFSSGPITGQNNNIVQGDVISAGPVGLIDGVHATSSAYAHTISDSLIEGDAHYQNISETTVLGQLFPGSLDQESKPLPITDEMIANWEVAAEAGGVISSPCTYEIKNNITLGPIKINCDVNISGSPTITLTGNVWVVGNINMSNSSIIRADTSMGNKSVVVIADKPSNRLTSSTIELENNVEFFGSGEPGSYVLFVSQNNSAESGGGNKAIEIENSAKGEVILYAPHGEVLLKNNVNLREVTAYRIRLQNNATVSYNMGLQNLLFSTGPSGGYQIIDWKEIE